MPYYIYKIHAPLKNLEKLAQYASFKEASGAVKQLRAASDPSDGGTLRMIFAENELQAEDLLSQVRPPEPMVGDDY
jgi:hypothetical protein